jgi:hypothetical protein
MITKAVSFSVLLLLNTFSLAHVPLKTTELTVAGTETWRKLLQ